METFLDKQKRREFTTIRLAFQGILKRVHQEIKGHQIVIQSHLNK